MDSIFVFLNGQQQGPYSRDRLQELLAENAIRSDTLAWHDGLPEWMPLSSANFQLVHGLGAESHAVAQSAAPVEDPMVTQPDEGLRAVSPDAGFAPEVRELSAGQRLFSRYELIRLIGRGGMGLVWLAKDETLGEDIALKFLPETVRLDPLALEELKRETRRSRKLSHWNIVKVHDFCSDGNAAGISMEFIDGDTLSGLRARQPHLCFEVAEIGKWTQQLVNALGYAHEQARVVHRDLKPANIMITREGNVKITDFGIASSIAENISRVTIQRGSSGTLSYMSPQQAMGRAPSPQDDIYALGATLFELLTGKPPFFRGDILAQVSSIMPDTLAERRAELEVTGDAIPEAWEETIAACLAKKPEDRPQSMAEVGVRLGLETAIVPRVATRPVPAPRVVTTVTPVDPTHLTVEAVPVDSALSTDVRRGHRRLLVCAIVALLVLFLAACGWLYYACVVEPVQKLRLAQQQLAQKEAEREAKIAAGESPEAAGYRAKALAGDAAAAGKLGRLYFYGNGVPRNPAEALKWLQLAANGGDALGETLLGLAYYQGFGTAPNPGKAFLLYQQAAKQGFPDGEYHLGEAYENGYGVAVDGAQAVAWYQKAADDAKSVDDSSSALIRIGEIYQQGQCLPQDYAKALTYYEKAAAQGSADAQSDIGLLYINGWGVAKDYSQALTWFQKAYDQGETDLSPYCLGLLYQHGWGVTQDYPKALTLFQLGASRSRDPAYSEASLGEMYENGQGVPKDMKTALDWIKKSAANNYAPVQAALKRLGD